MDKPECRIVTWDKVNNLIEVLVGKMKFDKFKPDIVVAICRGGLIPARMVCDYLLMKNLVSIRVEHWGIAATVTGKAKLTQGLDTDIKGLKVLVVDDITDTGESLGEAIKYLKTKKPAEIKTAVLQHKTTSKFVPDYYGEKLEDWKWEIYPWMKREDFIYFIEGVLKEGRMTDDEIRKKLKEYHKLDFFPEKLLPILQNMEEFGKVKREVEGKKIYWVLK